MGKEWPPTWWRTISWCQAWTLPFAALCCILPFCYSWKWGDQCLSWAQLGVSLKISTDAIWAGNKRWGSSDLFSHRKTSFCMMSFYFGNTSLIWILNIKLCMFLNCKTAEKFSREERLNKTIMSRLLLILGDFLASSKIILFYIESFLSNTLLFSPFSLNNTLFN